MSGCPGPRPHDDYYIVTGDLHFRAENTTFKVHSYFFDRECCTWHNNLNSAVADDQPRKGSCDTHPIIIKNHTAGEFAKFLWVFYNPKFSVYDATVAEWKSILSIADEFNLPNVKDLAIRHLDKFDMNIGLRIQLYQKYNAPHSRLIPLLIKLCKRPETLTEEELELLEMKTSVVIFRARERLRSYPPGDGKSPLPQGIKDDDVRQALCALLGKDPNSTSGCCQKHKK